MYLIMFYVPTSHLDQVKNAMFDAGAGKVGQYDRCCWQVLGEGEYRALENSQPFLGEKGAVCSVAEYRVEMVSDADHILAVIRALKESHPYETPAYSFWEVHP
ncbi:MAG: NGG1p interacting factor NIF3 [Gammaproteobacteria bacterium RIFCSPHIGHO2_12_FULL_41_15]|nr:MAG: NGG1p interacting factor NIF3 [Gammaproteobacteria bacterium RIFCSPHIGHO2_12_FULL_41_15]